jgi:hypothetical protein
MLTENLEVVTLDETRERLVTPAPVLIAEQEVALGTAAALRARPKSRRGWIDATRVLLVTVRRAQAPSTHDGSMTRRDYPKRYAFLEDACLACAMDRL